jgi:hypothetical protein
MPCPLAQYYCADVGGGGMHDAAHADGNDYFARRVRETMVPNIARLLRRCRALGGPRCTFFCCCGM